MYLIYYFNNKYVSLIYYFNNKYVSLIYYIYGTIIYL